MMASTMVVVSMLLISNSQGPDAVSASLSPHAPPAALSVEGDITIDAADAVEVECLACSGGRGLKICYEVDYAFKASADAKICDFHIRVYGVSDLKYPAGCASGPANWYPVHICQDEIVGGEEKKICYMNWATLEDSDCDLHGITKGNSGTFCLVYCGPDNSLDNTIEFIATNDGSFLPEKPDGNGNRGDVPDHGGNDDPGWFGTKAKAPGSKVGFISVDVPTVSTWGLTVLTLGLAVSATVRIMRVRTA